MDQLLNPFYTVIAYLLALFYSWVPSYGFAIIALTLVVMVILTPLTLKGTRSMMMMQQLQPEVKKLQTKYKDDRQQLNEELMKFYRENNISPLGGCLPLLVQMPVFIVLYNVLRGLTLRQPLTNAGWVSGLAGTGQPPTPPSVPPHFNFSPTHLPTDSDLYIQLTQTNTMQFAGMDLSLSCTEAFARGGIVEALPYIILILIVGASGFIQQRQIQGRNPNAITNPQQQMIMKFMPIFLPVISLTLPSGLVLYFMVSNLYRIGQQWFISRSIYGIKRGQGPGNAEDAKPGKGQKGGGGSTGAKPRTPKSGGSGGGNGKGRDKDTGGGKASGEKPAAKAGATSKAAKSNGASSGAAAKSTKSASGNSKATPANRSGGSARTGDPSKATPTLQPRARKNKKR